MNSRIDLAPAFMETTDLDDVMLIENLVYPHPWTRNNFADSLNQGHDAWVVRQCQGEVQPSQPGSVSNLIGYFVQMTVVDEMHILNVTVTPASRGQGIGLYLLRHMLANARTLEMESMLLEVRASNQRAIHVYTAFGFKTIGRRKNYYPHTPTQREDALVMRLILSSQP